MKKTINNNNAVAITKNEEMMIHVRAIMDIAGKKSLIGAKKAKELALKVADNMWSIAKTSFSKLSDLLAWAYGHLRTICSRLWDAIQAFFTTLFAKQAVVA
jgi:hypothetical protein